MSAPGPRWLKWMAAGDLSRVAISAVLDDNGNLGPVGGMDRKSLAAFDQAARSGGRRLLIVSDQQSGLAADDSRLAADAFPLRIIRAPTLAQAVESLYEDDGPRHAIRDAVRRACDTLDLVDRRVPLVQPGGQALYQELPLLREVKRERLPRARRADAQDNLPSDDFQDDRPGAAAILRWEEEQREERVTYQRQRVDAAFSDDSRAFCAASGGVPRFVVVAPPGGGKTTLLQALAYRAAIGDLTLRGLRLLPACVQLRLWEKWAVKPNEPESGLPEFLAKYCYKETLLEPTPTADQWRRWLKHGDILVLLDGLDEVNGEPEFAAAVRSALVAYPRCPTVITCRTVSYEQHQALCGEFPVFTLDGLNDRSRDAYVRAYPARHSRFDAPGLIEQINRLPAMRPLAANPQLLMLLCFAVDHSSEIELPATRGELFDPVVDRLLGRVRKRRVPVTYPDGDRRIPLSSMRRIVERIALALFGGTDQQRRLTVDPETLVKVVTEAVRLEEYKKATAEVADALVADLVHNCGLLRGNDDTGYFFLHLAVQEFLVASALARLVNAKGWDSELRIGKSRRPLREWIDKKAWDPRWREVICMLAGRLEDPEPLLMMLSDPRPTATNPEGDDLFHQRLALAATTTADIPEFRRRKLAATIGKLTTRVFARWWNSERLGTGRAHGALRRALPSLALVNGKVPNHALPNEWIDDGGHAAAGAIPQVPLMDRIAKLLRDHDVVVRSTAAEAVGGMGAAAATGAFLAEIAKLLRDPNSGVRSGAAKAVGGVGAAAATESVLAQIAELLGDPEWRVRSAAAQAVGGMGAAAATGAFLAEIAKLLKHTVEGVRSAAAKAVGGMGAAAATDEFLAEIAKLLRDPNSGVRSGAAKAVGSMGAAEATAPFRAEIARLLGDPEWRVRSAAAQAVGGMGAAAAAGFLALIAKLLCDDDLNVQYAAAFAVRGMARPRRRTHSWQKSPSCWATPTRACDPRRSQRWTAWRSRGDRGIPGRNRQVAAPPRCRRAIRGG